MTRDRHEPSTPGPDLARLLTLPALLLSLVGLGACMPALEARDRPAGATAEAAAIMEGPRGQASASRTR